MAEPQSPASDNRTGAGVSRSPDSQYPGVWSGYTDSPQEMPLTGYATLMGAYLVVFGGLLAGRRTRGLPERIALPDVVLFGVATHKIGRIVTKDWVTSPLRAPFTEYTGSAGSGEVSEHSRGAGLRRAVGDLLTCPWCIAPWVAGGLYSTFISHPRAARLVGSVFTSVAISDALQHAYSALKKTT